MKDSEKGVQGWMIKVLTENKYGINIIKYIAREKLGISEAMVVPVNIVTSLFKLKNMLLAAFSKFKSVVETF